MSTAPSPHSSILAAVDYSDTASLVVAEAVALAHQKRAAELHFLHVSPVASSDEGQEARHAELIEWLGARIPSGQDLPPTLKVIAHEAVGDPAAVILETSSDLSVDVVVVGTHGRTGVQRLLMGSVAAVVVQKCGCPVLVVRPKAHPHPAAQIEPPCPACVEARAASKGQTLWCDQHAEKHGRRHTYYDPRANTWVSQRLMP